MEKANEVYKELLNSASKFLSPSYRNFFTRKAYSDFESLQKTSTRDNSAISNYIKEQKDLKDSLDRSSIIYNMYRDPRSTL